jgi:hypothetical protein
MKGIDKGLHVCVFVRVDTLNNTTACVCVCGQSRVNEDAIRWVRETQCCPLSKPFMLYTLYEEAHKGVQTHLHIHTYAYAHTARHFL